MQYFDTHFHLDPEDDPAALVARAQAAGVAWLLAAGTTAGNHAALLARLAPFPGVFVALGVHPHEAEKATDDVAQCRALLANPQVRAIGEIGLDYYYDTAPRAVQRRVCRDFLELAAASGKPAILHCRDTNDQDAYADALALLADTLPAGHPFVVHCYTGTVTWAERFLARGGYLSYTGLITFKKADNVRAALRITPRERLFFETDSPYLAPVPHRGERNQPANLPLVAARAAAELGLPLPELVAQATANARRFFGV